MPKNSKQNHKLKNSLFVFLATAIFSAGFFAYPLIEKNYTTPTPVTANTVDSAINVCFTPNQPCLPMVVKYINSAKTNVLLLGYSFTSKPITQALIGAKKRGVIVKIILDHSQLSQRYSKETVRQLLVKDIDLRFDHSVKIAHNKVMVIDNIYTITGSYNWTHSAEFKNAENLVFIKSPEIAKKYSDYFAKRWQISKVKERSTFASNQQL